MCATATTESSIVRTRAAFILCGRRRFDFVQWSGGYSFVRQRGRRSWSGRDGGALGQSRKDHEEELVFLVLFFVLGVFVVAF
jgi:hypothetical protein